MTRLAQQRRRPFRFPERTVAVELVERRGRGRVLVHRSTRPGVEWQATWFDANGEPWGHTEHATLDEAVRRHRDSGSRIVEVHVAPAVP